MEKREYAELKRRILDEEHLRLLAIFHFVYGGLTLLMALFFLFYTGVLTMVMSGVAAGAAGPDAEVVGTVFNILAGVFGTLAFLALVYGICLIVSGILMQKRKARLFSFIIAIPDLIAIPWGTLLSVFTLVVLSRESVKALYDAARAETGGT